MRGCIKLQKNQTNLDEIDDGEVYDITGGVTQDNSSAVL